MTTKIRFISATAAILFLSGSGLRAVSQSEPNYKDSSLPVSARVEDLLSRMTIEEKIAQISHLHSWYVFDGKTLNMDKMAQRCGSEGFGFFEAFPLTAEETRKTFRQMQTYMVENTRLGIPAFPVAESLHGVVHEGATIYPQNIALGSTFNQELAYEKAKHISGELNTMGVRQVLSPCIDVVRELRWGRVEESYSEDPFLCSQMAVKEVQGYLDNGISPMLKHYGPHGDPQGGLNLASVDCGIRDLFDIYLKPFEKVIEETDVLAVMSSYNSWNRVPNSASKFMLTDILRDKFGFKGYVYSDWGVIDMLKSFHHTAADDVQAAYQALSAGLDVEASSLCFQSLPEKVRAGEFDIRLIDRAVRRVLEAKFILGLFEDPYQEAANYKLPLQHPSSLALSRKIADESTVLLKNEGGLLPLNIKQLNSIAVIGPNADKVQFGDYTWSKNKADGITPLQGIRELCGTSVKVNYAQGCSIASPDCSGIQEAVEAVLKSDVAVVFIGSSSTSFVRHSAEPSTSGEGIDLSEIELTGAQQPLLEAIKATGKPMVVVFVAGKPFAMPWVKENVPAVLAQWYAGQEEGRSIADILFGNVNPSGKLSFSFPQSTGHLPCYYNYLTTDKGFYNQPGTISSPGRDYVFSSPDALWSFGHGLSYTEFSYLSASTDKKCYAPYDTIKVNVQLKNTGSVAGKEVVQVYVRDVVSTVMTPIKELKAFSKVLLEPGETSNVILEIPVHELYLTDNYGGRYLEDGEFELQVGTSSDNIFYKLPVYAGTTVSGSFTNLLSAGNDSLSELAPRKASELGRSIRIKGVVRDVQATPLKGVEIHDIDGRAAAITDGNGNFEMKVHQNSRLSLSKAGYTTQLIEVKSQKDISVQLKK